MSRNSRILVLLVFTALAACSPRALFDTGQAWQRQNCNAIEDARARTECLASASTSYEQYRRERD